MSAIGVDDPSELSRPEIQAILIHLRVEIRRPCPDHALLVNAVRKLQEQLLRA